MIKGQLVQFDDGSYAFRRRRTTLLTFLYLPVWFKRIYEYLDLVTTMHVYWYDSERRRANGCCSKNPMDVMVAVGRANDLMLAEKRGPDLGRVVDDERSFPMSAPQPVARTPSVVPVEIACYAKAVVDMVYAHRNQLPAGRVARITLSPDGSDNVLKVMAWILKQDGQTP